MNLSSRNIHALPALLISANLSTGTEGFRDQGGGTARENYTSTIMSDWINVPSGKASMIIPIHLSTGLKGRKDQSE